MMVHRGEFEGCEQRHNEERDRSCRERHRISRTHTVEDTGHEAREDERTYEPDPKTHENNARSLPDDGPQEHAGVGPECPSDGDLSNPLTTAAFNVWLNRPPAKGLRAGGR